MKIKKFKTFTGLVKDSLAESLTMGQQAAVVNYLLGNSFKFSPKGETHLHLAVKENSTVLFNLVEKTLPKQLLSKLDFNGKTAYDLALAKALHPSTMNSGEWLKVCFDRIPVDRQKKVYEGLVEHYLKNKVGSNKIKSLLEMPHFFSNDFSHYKKNELAFACTENHANDLLQKIMFSGVDPSIKNFQGQSLLSITILKGNFQALKLMIEQGVNFKVPLENGKSAIQLLNDYAQKHIHLNSTNKQVNEIKLAVEQQEKRLANQLGIKVVPI